MNPSSQIVDYAGLTRESSEGFGINSHWCHVSAVPRQLATVEQKIEARKHINAVISENVTMEIKHEWDMNPGCRQIHRHPGAP